MARREPIGRHGETAPTDAASTRAAIDDLGERSNQLRQARDRGATVTAHATQPAGTKAAVLGGVTSIEHGDQIDDDLASEMADRGTFLVTTHSVFRSWKSFGSTTTLERFTGSEGRARIGGRYESAQESARRAHRAGVPIAAGSDFGGGSLRAGHLAWEVEALVEIGLEPLRRWPPPPGGVASCSASRPPVSSRSAAPPTPSSSMAIR